MKISPGSLIELKFFLGNVRLSLIQNVFSLLIILYKTECISTVTGEKDKELYGRKDQNGLWEGGAVCPLRRSAGQQRTGREGPLTISGPVMGEHQCPCSM